MHATRRATLAALVLLAALAAGAARAGATGAAEPARTPALRPATAGSSPCGRAEAHPRYTHVVWVLMENDPYSAVIGSPQAPFVTSLARACGIASDDDALTHPSLPNYIALTSGSTFGIADDDDPSSHRLTAPSIFSQLTGKHLAWRSYEESMTEPCEQVSAGLYAVKHNPAAYYVPLRAQCDRFDVPMGPLATGAFARALASASFPSFAFVTPNVCDDGHSCPLSSADRWLRRLVAVVAASRTYAEGHLALFVTWDEGIGSDQRVPLLVVAPSVRPGTVATGAFDHYSLLRTTEELLGLGSLGGAAHAASLVAAFRL